jgi:toxin-antitoxin system PIN domain toxin
LKTCLPDINVWIALASDRHVHHEAAKSWFAGIEPGGTAFCRVTQMGFLRLTTNRHVMGADVVTQKEAWQVIKNFRATSASHFCMSHQASKTNGSGSHKAAHKAVLLPQTLGRTLILQLSP